MKNEKVIVEVFKAGEDLPKYALYSKEEFLSLIQDLKKFKKEGRRIISGKESWICGIKEGDLDFAFRDPISFKLLAHLIVRKH